MNNLNMKCKCGKSEAYKEYDGLCHECHVKYGMTDDERECYYNQPAYLEKITSNYYENQFDSDYEDAFSLVDIHSEKAAGVAAAQVKTSLAFLSVAAFSIIASAVFAQSVFQYASPMTRCQEFASFDTCFVTLHR